MYKRVRMNFQQALQNPTVRLQLKRYLVTGFTSFGVEYAMFGVLIYWFQNLHANWYQRLYSVAVHFSQSVLHSSLSELSYRSLTANCIVYVLVFWLNFLLNRNWSFQSKEPLGKQMIQYGFLFMLNLVVGNIALLYLFTNIMGIPPMFSKVIIMGFIVTWNFILYKKIIYKT